MLLVYFGCLRSVLVNLVMHALSELICKYYVIIMCMAETSLDQCGIKHSSWNVYNVIL